jgi:RecQ family ATP-dependent DNA helicase
MSDDGSLRLLYTTPESLQTPRLIEVLSAAHRAGRLCSLAVDEAHCISSWGHDFRESYLQIGSFRDHLPGLPCIAVTATATPDVQASIKTNLKLRSDAAVLIGSFNRRNIALTVKHKELIGDGSQEAVTQEILDLIESKNGEKGIIYCRLRATCDELATALLGADVDVAAYHAGLDQQRRSRVQNDFKEGSLNAIVATVAFGMGVDIPDVRWVVHVDPPATIEGMYQELGRAGRDGHPAVHVLFGSDSDLRQASKMERGPKCGATAAVAAYVQSACCRRQSLLAHFGERRGVCSSNDKDEELCDFCLDAGGVRKRLEQVEEKLAAAQALANPSAGAATLPERSTINMSFAGQSRRESTKRPKFLLATACEQPEAGNSENEMPSLAPKENSAPDFVLGIKRQRQFVVPRRLKDEV